MTISCSGQGSHHRAKNNEYERRIRSRHNKGFRGLMYGIEEGWVDRMASLRIIQDAITGNKAVPDTANAYMLENQLTSRNTAEIRFFNKHMVDPVIKQIEKLFGNNMEAADVYMNAKHGLERNEYMAREEAKRKYVDNIKAIEGDLQEGNIDQAAYDLKMAEIADKIEALYEKTTG